MKLKPWPLMKGLPMLCVLPTLHCKVLGRDTLETSTAYGPHTMETPPPTQLSAVLLCASAHSLLLPTYVITPSASCPYLGPHSSQNCLTRMCYSRFIPSPAPCLIYLWLFYCCYKHRDQKQLGSKVVISAYKLLSIIRGNPGRYQGKTWKP